MVVMSFSLQCVNIQWVSTMLLTQMTQYIDCIEQIYKIAFHLNSLGAITQ